MNYRTLQWLHGFMDRDRGPTVHLGDNIWPFCPLSLPIKGNKNIIHEFSNLIFCRVCTEIQKSFLGLCKSYRTHKSVGRVLEVLQKPQKYLVPVNTPGGAPGILLYFCTYPKEHKLGIFVSCSGYMVSWIGIGGELSTRGVTHGHFAPYPSSLTRTK